MPPSLFIDTSVHFAAICPPFPEKLSAALSPAAARALSTPIVAPDPPEEPDSSSASPSPSSPTSPWSPTPATPSLSFGVALPTAFVAVHHAFRFHALTRPNALAAEHPDAGARATYAELDVASQHLAARLRARGVRPGACVGLLVRRGVPMLVGILAVLKAGGTYVPLDGGVATDAILAHVLGDAAPLVVLASRPFVGRPSALGYPSEDVICLEDAIEKARAVGGRPLVADMTEPDDAAYIIYTSGTHARTAAFALQC